MTGDKDTSVQDAFFAFAKDKIGFSPRMLTEYLQKAADYCHLKQPILGMTNARTVYLIQQKVAEGKLLRFRFGKDAQTIRNVTQLYYSFIKNYREPKDEAVISVAPSAEPNTVNQRTSDTAEAAPVPAPAISLDEFASRFANVQENEHRVETVLDADTASTPSNDHKYTTIEGYMPSQSEEHREIVAADQHVIDNNYDWQRSDLLLVDWFQEASYAFTRPEAYEYNGVTRCANKWGKLYVDLCGLLFEDHRDAFMGIMNGDIPGYNSLAFADEQHKSKIRVARQFAPGYYLESNIDATSIVRRIRGLYLLFNLGDSLRISYTRIGDSHFPHE